MNLETVKLTLICSPLNHDSTASILPVKFNLFKTLKSKPESLIEVNRFSRMKVRNLLSDSICNEIWTFIARGNLKLYLFSRNSIQLGIAGLN